MKIETERLILRELEDKDSKSLSKQGNDKDINFFNWYIPFPFNEADAKKLILEREEDAKSEKRKFYSFAICLKETGDFIGMVEIYDYNETDWKAKLGYWLGKDSRGKGYISEALKEIIKFGFEKLKLNKISASVIKSNEKSMNVLKKFKFRKIGIKKKEKLFEGAYYDTILFELLN